MSKLLPPAARATMVFQAQKRASFLEVDQKGASRDAHRLGTWLRQHIATPVGHAAHNARQFGHDVGQTVRLFGHRQAGAGQPGQPVHQQPAAPIQNSSLHPVPFLRVGDPAVRTRPPTLYQTQWVRGNPPVYSEIPVRYVQSSAQTPVWLPGNVEHDDLITYF